MPIISVRAVIAHYKLGFIPITRGSHQWCQGPGDSSTILPCEGTLGLIPDDFNSVPVVVSLIAMEIKVNLVEARDAIHKLLCAEMMRLHRRGNGQDEGKKQMHLLVQVVALKGTSKLMISR